MAENDDIDLKCQPKASTKRPRLSRKKRKLVRKQKPAATSREFPIQLSSEQRDGTKLPRADQSSEDRPFVKFPTLSPASPTRSNPPKRPRVETAPEKLGDHSIGPLLLGPATTPRPKTKLPPPAPKSTPLAYFVDVCLPEPPALESTIDLENFSSIHYGCVPFDILSEIFVLCLPSQISRRTKRKEAPLVLCHVCRHWRRVALETSILWDTFSAVTKEGQPRFHQKLLHLYLNRSRNRPLTLVVSGPAENRFMEVLLSRVGRWKDVTVIIDASANFAKLFFKLSFTPLLEALTIDVTTCNDPEILQKIPYTIARMAQLRRLTWKGEKLPPTFLYAPLHQLTHLDISCPFTMHDCVSILRRCPRLVMLKLDLKTASNPIPPSDMLISIPTVTHIDVIVYCELADFLHHLHLPGLSYIRTIHRRPHTHSFISLEDFCTRSGCTLDTFWINDRHQTPYVVQRYVSLPCLQSIRELHIFAGGVGDDFLKSLMVPNISSPAPLLLPHLKRLVVGRCITSDGLFAKMIASRCTSEEGRRAGTGFEMVRALFRKGKGRIVNRHPEDILGFRAMAKDVVKVSWGWK